MLPYNHSVRICGDVVGPKYPFLSAVNGRGIPKSSLAILKLISSVEIGKPPNRCPIKREDRVLPIAQVKSAYLSMKLPPQSLPDLVLHGVRGDPQEILKSLLSQKLSISLVGPRRKQQPKKGGPRTPTSYLVGSLHSKSEAIR